MRHHRPSHSRRKELVPRCFPDLQWTYLDLSQLGHVEELSEIGPETGVSAKTMTIIHNLVFGRSSPDSAEDEPSLGVYLIRSRHLAQVSLHDRAEICGVERFLDVLFRYIRKKGPRFLGECAAGHEDHRLRLFWRQQ